MFGPPPITNATSLLYRTVTFLYCPVGGTRAQQTSRCGLEFHGEILILKKFFTRSRIGWDLCLIERPVWHYRNMALQCEAHAGKCCHLYSCHPKRYKSSSVKSDYTTSDDNWCSDSPCPKKKKIFGADSPLSIHKKKDTTQLNKTSSRKPYIRSPQITGAGKTNVSPCMNDGADLARVDICRSAPKNKGCRTKSIVRARLS